MTKVHVEVAQIRAQGRDVMLIGHAGHPEVEGTMGQFDDGVRRAIRWSRRRRTSQRLEVRDPAQLAYVTQTTLSVDDTAAIVDALRTRFPTSPARGRKTSAMRRRTARTR